VGGASIDFQNPKKIVHAEWHCPWQSRQRENEILGLDGRLLASRALAAAQRA